MKLQVYSLYDTAAEAYTHPFTAVNAAVAIRSCQQLMRAGDSPAAQYPEQFQLWHLAEFEDSTGLYYSQAGPVQLGAISTFKE